jgi:hypothetical protein
MIVRMPSMDHLEFSQIFIRQSSLDRTLLLSMAMFPCCLMRDVFCEALNDDLGITGWRDNVEMESMAVLINRARLRSRAHVGVQIDPLILC